MGDGCLLSLKVLREAEKPRDEIESDQIIR